MEQRSGTAYKLTFHFIGVFLLALLVMMVFWMHSAWAAVPLHPGTRQTTRLMQVALVLDLPFFSGESAEAFRVTDRMYPGTNLERYFPEWNFYTQELVFSRNTYVFVAVPKRDSQYGKAYILGYRNRGMAGGGWQGDVNQEWSDFLRFGVREIMSERHLLAVARLYAMARAPRAMPDFITKPSELPPIVAGLADVHGLEFAFKPPEGKRKSMDHWVVTFTTYEKPGNLVSWWNVEVKLGQFEGFIRGYQQSLRAVTVPSNK